MRPWLLTLPGHISETTKPIWIIFWAINHEVYKSRHSEFHCNMTRLRVRFLPPHPVCLFGKIWYCDFHASHQKCCEWWFWLYAFFSKFGQRSLSSLCVHACMCGRGRRCMHACVRACVQACMCERGGVHACMCEGMCACMHVWEGRGACMHVCVGVVVVHACMCMGMCAWGVC